MEITTTEAEVLSKDDFFDDNQGKQNGEIPSGISETVTKSDPGQEVGKDSGDDKKDEEAVMTSSTADEKQDQDAVAASSGDGGDGATASVSEEQTGADSADAAQQEQVVDGFQSTSPPPTIDAPQPPQSADEDLTAGQQPEMVNHTDSQQPEQEVKEPEEPEEDQNLDNAKEAEGQPEVQQEGQGDDAPVPEGEKDEEKTGEAQPEEVGGAQAEEEQHDYEDSFSECSQKSVVSADCIGKVADKKAEDGCAGGETVEAERQIEAEGAADRASPISLISPTPCDSRSEATAAAAVEEEQQQDKDTAGRSSPGVTETTESGLEPAVDSGPIRESSPEVKEEKEEDRTSPQHKEQGDYSPSPCDSRAEAGSVVPMVVEEVVDGHDNQRSETEQKEQGENRGEDRPEAAPPEGYVDSRGENSWKSVEYQQLSCAAITQTSEQDEKRALQEEKDKLADSYDQMKTSLHSLELELDKKSDLLVAEREANASNEKKIHELHQQLGDLQATSKMLQSSEERVKDLQDRLAVVTRESKQKDERILHLENELKLNIERLIDTERKLALSEEARASRAEAPKSKTCHIM